MLDSQPQTARSGGPDRDPVCAFGEGVVGQGCAESLVIDAKVLAGDPGFGDAGAAARLEHENGFVLVSARNPAAHRTSPQPLILKWAQAAEIVIAMDFAPRVPAQLSGVFQPAGAAGFGAEMPLDHFPRPGVQLLAGRLHLGFEFDFNCWAHVFPSIRINYFVPGVCKPRT